MKTPKEKVVLNGMGRPKKIIPEVSVDVPPPAVAYTIEVEIGKDTFSNSGNTVLEALQGLTRPLKITSKGYVTVHHGEHTKKLFFMPAAMKRIFYPLSEVSTAKMLGMNV